MNLKKCMFFIILVLSVMVSVIYGFKKSGFHEDEYYTYYSSNRSLGLYQPDREWQDRQTILDEFTVKEGEEFNYGLVKLVQSWDVHPPFYYYIFHSFCSLAPGVFTKWTGIIPNLIAFVLSFVFLFLIMEKLGMPISSEMLVLFFFGINPQTVSANMLIRMYAWLTAAIFACAYYHICLIKDYDNNSMDAKHLFVKNFLPIMVVSYLGFLIQYFYIFFFVSIGFATAVYIVFIKKGMREGIFYVLSCTISLLLAVMTYPSALSHMFGGYRGGDASGSFFDIQNTSMRLSFFLGLLNDFVFAGGLILIVLVLLIGTIIKMYSAKGKKVRGRGRINPEVTVLAVGTIGYFLLTSKTALLVGSASNRYEMPVYGLLILLIFLDVDYVFDAIKSRVFIFVFAAVCMFLLIKGHMVDGRVLFLYPEDEAKIEYAKENSQEVAVVMFNPATPQNVWRLTDELLQYPKVYYMDEENTEPITDESILGADKIILYAADDDKQKEAFENLMSCCRKLSVMSEISGEDMWTTYEISSANG